MLSLLRPFVQLMLLSVLFMGCGGGGGGSSSHGNSQSANNSLAGKTYYSISEAEIGVIDLHEQGEATVTRTITALDHTEQVDAQWQLADSVLAVDIGSEHREFGVDENGDVLTEDGLQWQKLITPSAELLAGDFWLVPRGRDPMQHFRFNADGSGVVYFYFTDEPASAAMQWQIEGKAIVVNYSGLGSGERFFITGNAEPGHLSVISFGGLLSTMYSYLAEFVPFTPRNETVATADQIRGKHFHGWLTSEHDLLALREDGTYLMTIIPIPGTGAGFTESYEENGNWQIDDSGVLTLDSSAGLRQFTAKMGQAPFLESGSYRYRFFDIVENADIAGISWSAGGIAFWFDASGSGFARMGSVDSGQKIPFTWQQQHDRILLDSLGRNMEWIVTALDRNLGILEVMQLTREITGYRSLDSMSFRREQLPPATAELVGGRRYYRLDDKKAELLKMDTGWFDTKILDLQTDASSDDNGSWQIDSQGRISLAGQQITRLLIGSNIAGTAYLQEGTSNFYPLRKGLAPVDFVGQWQAPGTSANLLLNADGTGAINNGVTPPINLTWQIVDDHAHVEFSASPSLVYDWYLTLPVQQAQAASILQCKVSGGGCSDVEFLPFTRQ